METLKKIDIFGLTRSLKARAYFETLVQKDKWRESLKLANNSVPSPNGADSFQYVDGHKDLIATNNVIDLLKQEQCFWLLDLIILVHRYALKDEPFYSVWLLINENGNFLIFDNGNYEPIASYEIAFTDFGSISGHDSIYFIVENRTILMSAGER